MIEWVDSEATRWTSDVATVNGYRLEVCLDDEGPIRPAFYWTIEQDQAPHDVVTDGWSSSVDQAKGDAIAAALAL